MKHPTPTQVRAARTRANKSLGENLAATWISHCEATGMSRAQALRQLNAVTCCGYTSSRLNEWIRGARHPDRRARFAMLQEVLPVLLDGLGVRLTPDHYSDLAEALT